PTVCRHTFLTTWWRRWRSMRNHPPCFQPEAWNCLWPFRQKFAAEGLCSGLRSCEDCSNLPRYGVSSVLFHRASDTNSVRICLYLDRMRTGCRVLSVRDASLRDPKIKYTAGYTKENIGATTYGHNRPPESNREYGYLKRDPFGSVR